jgi:hypothetical protein
MVHEFAPVAKLLDTSLLEAANVGACSMSRNNVPDIFPVPPEKKVVWYIRKRNNFRYKKRKLLKILGVYIGTPPPPQRKVK